jgi:hypothetical protein
MKHDRDSTEAHQRMMALIEEMAEQTDRGAAIVAAAWVEEAMSAAIESFLHSDTKAWQRLFEGNGPLATMLSFSSPHIRDKCFALRCVSHEKNMEPRAAFVRACAILNSDFEMVSLIGVKIPDAAGWVHAEVEK